MVANRGNRERPASYNKSAELIAGDVENQSAYSCRYNKSERGKDMNLERVVFGFIIILALSFTFAFVMGDIDSANHHNVWILTIAILINLIATGLKLGDRSQVGALLLASSLVVDVLLISARVIWITAENQTPLGPNAESMANIVSLAGGALVASVVTVVIVVGDTLISRR
jgi:hypothetical protein